MNSHPPIVGLQSLSLVKLGLHAVRLAQLDQHASERYVGERVIGLNPDELAKSLGSFRELTALLERLPRLSSAMRLRGRTPTATAKKRTASSGLLIP